jgi:rare lipoprotein A
MKKLPKNVNRFIFSFIFFLFFSPCVFAQTVFKDVEAGDNNYVAIKFLKERGVISGYADGTYGSTKEINRAEALKILLKTLPTVTAPQKNATFSFADVTPPNWFYEIIREAYLHRIINGYPDQLFHPENAINRVEGLKIILLQENNPLPVTIPKPPYTDVPVDSWFAAYAQVAKERGLILENRSNGGIIAAKTLSRGEFAELMYRTIQSSFGSKFARASYYSDYMASRYTTTERVYLTAHRTLPFGTRLLVRNLANGKEIEVKVNDRGPFVTGVDLDLSKSAFAAIADPATGIITTEYKILSVP